MNTDQDLFLRLVEKGSGNLTEIVRLIKETGELTDDLSLLRFAFASETAVNHPFDAEHRLTGP
jgi:hypothetical protein